MDVDLSAAKVVQDDRLAALGWLGRAMERQRDLEPPCGPWCITHAGLTWVMVWVC